MSHPLFRVLSMDVRGIVERVEGADVSVADRSTVLARLADVGRLASWVEAQRVRFTARLEQLQDCRCPEEDVALSVAVFREDRSRGTYPPGMLRREPCHARALAA